MRMRACSRGSAGYTEADDRNAPQGPKARGADGRPDGQPTDLGADTHRSPTLPGASIRRIASVTKAARGVDPGP